MSHSPDTVLAFARATLTGDDVIVIGADNKRVGYLSLEEATRRGVAFAGDLQEGRVVLDADPDEGGERWTKPGRQALEGVGCSIVRVASGREGHQHIWAVGPVGWTNDELIQVAKDAGVPAKQIRHGQMDVRPPLSPHRLGLPISLIEPADVGEALGRVSTRPGQTTWDEARWSHVLEHGQQEGTPGTYSGRSQAVMAVAVAMVNAGLPFDTLVKRLSFSPKLAEKATEESGKWLARTWRTANRYVRHNPPVPNVHAYLETVALTAQNYPWPGRRDRDRRVYDYLASYCVEYRWTQIAKDQRSIAMATGMPHGTVNSVLRRLRREGFLRVVSAGSKGQATTYALIPKIAVPGPIETSRPLISKRGNYCSANCDFEGVPDVFQGFLPYSSLDTWRALPPDTWVTTKQIVELRPGGLKPTTVVAHLKALHSAGLVDRNSPQGHRWRVMPVEAVDLERIARSVGVAGVAELRAEQIEREREMHRAFLPTPKVSSPAARDGLVSIS